MMPRFCSVTLFLIFGGIASPYFANAQQSALTKESISVASELKFLSFLPTGYEQDSAKKWPMILFLHGAGERGNNLDLVQKWGPPKRVASGKDFPFILVSPQCPAGTRWNIDHLNQLLDHVVAKNRVDEKRIYLTGLSMGGFASWALAAKYPEKFAAIAPVCGGGDPAIADKLLHLPIWAFHGDKDKVVPLSMTTRIVDAIKSKGGDQIKLTVYEGVNHNSWTQTYANEELYDWFLSHHRK